MALLGLLEESVALWASLLVLSRCKRRPKNDIPLEDCRGFWSFGVAEGIVLKTAQLRPRMRRLAQVRSLAFSTL